MDETPQSDNINFSVCYVMLLTPGRTVIRPGDNDPHQLHGVQFISDTV